MGKPVSLVELSVITGYTIEELGEELPGLIEDGLVVEIEGGYLITAAGLESID